MTEAFFDRAPHARPRSPRRPIRTPPSPPCGPPSARTTSAPPSRRDGDDVHVCADRFRWGPFGRIVAHLSFVVILLGATLTATGGFRDEGFAVPVGEKMSVGNGTDLTVEAKSFSDSYYTSGEPSDYASKLVLYEDGAPVKSQEVRVNHPMRYDGVTFYQSFFGPTVVMRAKTDRRPGRSSTGACRCCTGPRTKRTSSAASRSPSRA